jgi:VCBS repeat-containing protein
MKYTGEGTTGWETVGEAGFSGGGILYPVIKFNHDDTPFVAFIASSGRSPYVMRYEDHPTITETDVTMSEDGDPIPFDLSLRGYDKDNDALTWAIAEQSAHGTSAIESVLGSTGVVTATFAYTPTANYNGKDSFVVQLDDGTDTVTATVNITIDPVNDAPIAKFADQTVAENETVTLDGTFSTDVDGADIVEYYWEQTGGTTVSFTDNISQTTFIAPAATDTLTFTLTVTDTGGLSDTHTGTVWVVEGDSSTSIPPDSETSFTPEGVSFTLSIPSGGVSQPTSVVYTESISGYSPPPDQQFFDDPFALTAYVNGEEQSDFTFDTPATITLSYSDSEMYGMLESTMNLQYWNGSDWSSEGITFVSQDTANNQITFTLAHLTDFAYMAEEAYMIHLPIVVAK